MDQAPDVEPNGNEAHSHSNEEWAELMARTVAHLAAQVTMMQIRLRALAGELADHHAVDSTAVQARVGEIARSEASVYLRENLGEALAEVIDAEALTSEIVDFLTAER